MPVISASVLFLILIFRNNLRKCHFCIVKFCVFCI
jgi:hypothetical protein